MVSDAPSDDLVTDTVPEGVAHPLFVNLAISVSESAAPPRRTLSSATANAHALICAQEVHSKQLLQVKANLWIWNCSCAPVHTKLVVRVKSYAPGFNICFDVVPLTFKKTNTESVL